MGAYSSIVHRPDILARIEPSAAEAASRLQHEVDQAIPLHEPERILLHPGRVDLLHQVYWAWSMAHPEYPKKRYVRGESCTSCVPELMRQTRERLSRFYASRPDLSRPVG